jgi:RNA polymerase sigma-70 factor (ECF subfamily)
MLVDECIPEICEPIETTSLPDWDESAEAASATDDRLVCAFNEARDELFGKLYSMLGNYEDTQDALQVAFLHCWRSRACLPELRSVRAWIWRVTLNAGRDLRDLVWRRRAKPLSVVEAAACYRHESPVDRLEDQEQQERLRAALVHLRPEEREVFLLRQNGALTYEEIAQQRGSPVGTAKTLMRKAVRKLRQALEEPEMN